jgi:hypothetical protein
MGDLPDCTLQTTPACVTIWDRIHVNIIFTAVVTSVIRELGYVDVVTTRRSRTGAVHTPLSKGG